MNIVLTPTIDIDDIIQYFGTSDFPFTYMVEDDSYVTVSLNKQSLKSCEEDIDFYYNNNCPFKMKQSLNLRNFIIKMNEMGYHGSILVYVHW